MSEEASKRWSRLSWWVGLALVLLIAAGLIFLFRVPLALGALRRGMFEKQGEWVVRNAGESAVPYLRGGLDDPDRDYAGLCARHLIGLAGVRIAEGRLDVIEEAVRTTNHVSFEFRPAYPKGSSALGFVRWTSEIGLPAGWDLCVEVGAVRDGWGRPLFGRNVGRARPMVVFSNLDTELEPSSSSALPGRRSGPWFRSDDLLWLDRLLKEPGRLTLEAEIDVRHRSVSLFKFPAARKEMRVVESVSECGDLPQPIHDPVLDAWVQKNMRASLSLFQGEVMLRLQSPVSNRQPLCFRITIETDDGERYVRPRHLVFRPGELMPMADFQTGLELTEPGTYRMRVILEGTPEAALSHPAVTRYWAGRYESPWQTLTVSRQ